LPWFIGVILGALLILAFIIFLMIKRLQDSPNRTFAYAADKPPKKPVFPAEPEVFRDDKNPQETNPLADDETIRLQRKIESPWVRPKQAALPVFSPDKQFAPSAGTVPRAENTGTPVPHSRLPGRLGKDTEYRDPAGSISRKDPRSISLMNSSRKKNIQPGHGPLMLSLFVEDQNTNIGRRNVHAVKSGYSFTIGGGKSDFLIFLVPVPPRIAELRSDGAQCTLIPRKPEFFPDTGSRQVPDCIGKPIRILSERRYELIIRIDRYEDPLITLNRLLHSVDVPGYWQEPG
jgi:hypothetical protein